jgi:hypothetical protein
MDRTRLFWYLAGLFFGSTLILDVMTVWPAPAVTAMTPLPAQSPGVSAGGEPESARQAPRSTGERQEVQTRGW